MLVDLRSDTVTRPTPAMRRAMAEAEVGDDQYGEDPTVRLLEEQYATAVGMAAALYVPSGTMANQLALQVLGRPGTVVIAGRRSHVVAYENAASARNAAVQLHPLDDADGLLQPADVAGVIDAARHHQPEASLICVETTHMASGGTCQPAGYVTTIAALGLPVHVDGARLFNAQVATGVPAAELVAGATSVMSCLSKGLGAPVGSVLAGPADVVAEARVERARMGGAMRQAGVIAAAGIVALESMVERLAHDHARARRLARVVADRWPGCGLDPDAVTTNVVVFRHADTDTLVARLREQGVLAGTIAPGTVRLVTHLDVDDEGVEHACRVLRDV